ncbi:DNA damage-induced apoptosis suppressor protein [Ctenodactylus gundi]
MSSRRKFLLGSVLALQNSSFIYPSCQKCFSRIILVSKRSHCPKCGSTGEAENSRYRYKLSLKVAESNTLLLITVFGSCLDAFFGLTATDLYRYTQDPNKVPEILDSDTTQNLLREAVETCFIGRTFIFGVTNFENQSGHGSDSSNVLQKCPGLRREVRALVACQIILPDPRAAGFTVIDYFHQLVQTFRFRTLNAGPQEPRSHLLTLDLSSSDVSNTPDFDNTFCFLESHSGDHFSKFCQLPLELTSIISQQTDKDEQFASKQSTAIGTAHQNRRCISSAEFSASGSCHDPILGSWSLASYMDKKETVEKSDEELDSRANQLTDVHSSHHEMRVTSYNLFPLKMQEHLESSNTEGFHRVMETTYRHSQYELPCYQHPSTSSLQERSICYPPSSLTPEDIASTSQDCDPVIWDDLPFSESLNKFLAAIESEITIDPTGSTNKRHSIDNDVGESHADCSRLPVTPQRTTRTQHTTPISLRSLQTTAEANCSKENFFSSWEASPRLATQRESQPANTAEVVSLSSNRIDVSQYFLPNTYLPALPPSSESLETTLLLKKTVRILPHRDKFSHRPHSSKSNHSHISLKYFNECGKKSPSEMGEKLTTLCSRRYSTISDLDRLENKHSWPENQGDNFSVCRKLSYPLESLCTSPSRSTDTLREIPYGHISSNLTQCCSAGHEGSYDASADLFDDTAKDKEIITESTEKSQDILLQWETSLAKNHPAESGLSPKSLSENSNQLSQKVCLQSMCTPGYQRTCSPLPKLQSILECDLEGSQDFFPCSQSTPVAGFHYTRHHGIHGAFKKLPAFYADHNAKQKKNFSPENDKQQPTLGCLQYLKTPSHKSRSPIITSITQPKVFNNYASAEGLETDTDEWIPPTTTKIFRSRMLSLKYHNLDN